MAFSLPVVEAAPHWIWSSPQAGEKEEAEFRKAFDLAAVPKRAMLKISADNAAQVLINGEPALSNDNWQQPSQANVAKRLRTGRNEIVVRAKNNGGPGGVVLTLNLIGEDGKTTVIESDASWTSVTRSGETRPVHVLGQLGAKPWGDVFAAAPTGTVVAAKDIQTLPGFTAELLYTVPKGEQGSWVSLTVDSQGRLICGDQYGGFYRLTPPPAGSANPEEETQVETLTSSIGGSHGLLWAHDSLYVVVNEKAGAKSEPGLWRLRDKDGDGTFEEETLLRRFEGSGEHGPHTPVLSPDGQSLYIANGNHTKLPQPLDHSRAARAWGEDLLLPRQWDANGHAAGILAPGGYIVKTDLDGKEMELFCYGFRNEFAIAFNAEGELFTYDSDMEWDMGTPWYRPTRIIHCVSGADYGWRSGSGKWPEYYPDSLPAVYDIGPGSPTGVTFGTGAAFPAKYQTAFYAADWTYGTMYAVHLKPEGASYKAEVEEFVSGKPLPLTSVVINPHDGAMYFAIGGRRTQSGVYRIRYTGQEPHDVLQNPLAGQPVPVERQQRRELEKLHTAPADPAVVEKAWPFLASPDRFLRYAARVALEKQPVDSWIARFRAETHVDAILEGAVALARVGNGQEVQNLILEKLSSLQGKVDPNSELALRLLRALQLTFVRQGKPATDIANQAAALLDQYYPSTNDLVNRELSQVLIFLNSPRAVPKTLQLMGTAREHDAAETASAALLARNEQYAKDVNAVMRHRPNRQQMALAWNLRNATAGWTPELRKQYFSWFPTTKKWRGGNSLAGFIENARKEALAKVPDEAERAALDALSTKVEEETTLAFTPPKGPGHAYTVDDVLQFAEGRLTGRNFESGKNLFAATACLTCHRFNGEGGGLGPDITGSGNRYTLRDLLENIIEPSKVISDQYESTQLDLKDGGVLVGRILKEENGKITLAINPLVPSATVELNASDVAGRQPYPISMMPPGLINPLNEEEVLDLLAYILSGGNPDDKAFKK